MGAGLALSFALADSEVFLLARRERSLTGARARMGDSLELLARHGALSGESAASVLGRVHTTTALSGIEPGVDLAIESIPEVLEDKRALLAELERHLEGSAVLTSNTSSLPLGRLSEALDDPARFAGYHWFNPPELIGLVEIVAARATSEETVAALRGWSLAAGKQPVVLASEVEGFVANRLQYALLREAYALVDAGVCTPAEVDRAVRAGLGPRWAALGPFETMDLAGLDVHLEVARRLFPSLSNAAGAPGVLSELVARGALGTKAGEGLLGSYDGDDLRRLAERRAAVVLAVARLLAEEQQNEAPES